MSLKKDIKVESKDKRFLELFNVIRSIQTIRPNASVENFVPSVKALDNTDIAVLIELYMKTLNNAYRKEIYDVLEYSTDNIDEVRKTNIGIRIDKLIQIVKAKLEKNRNMEIGEVIMESISKLKKDLERSNKAVKIWK